MSVEPGPTLVDLGRSKAKLGQILAAFGQHSAAIRPASGGGGGPTLSAFERIEPRFGKMRPAFREFTQPSFRRECCPMQRRTSQYRHPLPTCRQEHGPGRAQQQCWLQRRYKLVAGARDERFKVPLEWAEARASNALRGNCSASAEVAGIARGNFREHVANNCSATFGECPPLCHSRRRCPQKAAIK